ncbi:unnamed protein product [Chilo suppressalis]|uniref:Regulatory protein zeste n=1 Tax=Chilo suppressalis TaxID=168631 RepID=A0ABN8EDT6_CHISP|nr:unnamed protein product [Chilo suppressalis]
MSRTSNNQFEIMVVFMERNGDLMGPADGPHSRVAVANKWMELENVLNLNMTGSSKTVEKWKKVWSDFKNNTKRKAAKIRRAASGTDGGPACKLVLTDLEQRVLKLMGTQAATGLPNIAEVGLEPFLAADQQHDARPLAPPPLPQPQPSTSRQVEDNRSSPFTVEDVVGSATSPTPHHASHVGSSSRRGARSRTRLASRQRRRLPPCRTRLADAAANFLASKERWQNFAAEFAVEHICLRERELNQQAQWQTLFAKFIRVIAKFYK